MRGMKRYLWLFVLAMVMIMVSSSVRAEIIAFSSDREPPQEGEPPDPEHDVWLSRHDGSQQTLYSSTPDYPFTDHRSRPSICPDGQWIFYDNSSGFDEYLGDLWVRKISGAVQQPKEAFHCTNPTGSPNCFTTPEGVPHTIGTCWPSTTNPPPPSENNPCQCIDVDCGPPASSFTGNPRILFNYLNSFGTRTNIVVATWDVSTETLGTPCKLTDDGGGASDTPQQNFDPAWCGTNHAVFTRSGHEFPDGDVITEPTICIMAIPAPGATEQPEIRCHDTDDGLQERYPGMAVVGLWVGDDWSVAEIGDERQ